LTIGVTVWPLTLPSALELHRDFGEIWSFETSDLHTLYGANASTNYSAPTARKFEAMMTDSLLPEEAPDPTTNPDDIVSKPTQPLICAAQRALATVCAQEGAYHQAIEEFGKAVLAAEPVLDLRSIKARAEAWNHQAEKEPEGSAERAFACDVCVADCRAVLAGTDPEEHSAHIHAQMTLSRFLWVGAQMKKEDVATSAAAREAFNIADQVFHNQKSPLGSANNELARHIMRKIATDGLDVGTLNQRRYLTSTAEPTCDSLSGLS
jgi:hypothetical protein